MKQTRKIAIRDRVFTIDDLKRIAALFEKQHKLANKSDHHTSTDFEIRFSDDTSIESHSAEILTDSVVLGPARPVDVRFAFHNYQLDRHLAFAISHGDTTYGNVASVAASDSPWLNDNFVALKDAIETARPQTFWFRRHPTILLNLIALGLGSLFQFAIAIAVDVVIASSGLSSLIHPLPQDSQWRALITKSAPVLYLLQWCSRWGMGLFFAFQIRTWLLSLWPNIELDIGTEHLKTENLQRKRLIAVIILIIFPILRQPSTMCSGTHSNNSLDRSAGCAFFKLFVGFDVVDNRRARSTLTLRRRTNWCGSYTASAQPTGPSRCSILRACTSRPSLR